MVRCLKSLSSGTSRHHTGGGSGDDEMDVNGVTSGVNAKACAATLCFCRSLRSHVESASAERTSCGHRACKIETVLGL